MMLDGCHLCRNPEPREAMVVDMMTRRMVWDYHGVGEIIIQSQENASPVFVQRKIPFKVEYEPVSYSFHS